MIDFDDIMYWLNQTDQAALETLWRRADDVRRREVGDAVHLRGLLEISNICRRSCAYCGLRRDNRDVERYRMSPDEILASARAAAALGYGTVVLQGGEDEGLTGVGIAELIRRIKTDPATAELAVTLSLGERTEEELALWRQAGADRYLLRFETSNADLFARIHPPRAGQSRSRLDVLRQLRDLDYEVGSGVMIGIPGQSCADLARDILLFAELGLDMIGVGPFIAHPATPLGRGELPPLPADRQAPNSELMTYKVVALTRLACPRVNLPGTTALATLNFGQGRLLALQRGANVIMPNVTPPTYRAKYEIYPAKACLRESPRDFNTCLKRGIEAIGRFVGVGRGDSPCRSVGIAQHNVRNV